MVDEIGQMISPLHGAPLKDCFGGIVEQVPFGRVKDALSTGASSMIIQPYGCGVLLAVHSVVDNWWRMLY